MLCITVDEKGARKILSCAYDDDILKVVLDTINEDGGFFENPLFHFDLTVELSDGTDTYYYDYEFEGQKQNKTDKYDYIYEIYVMKIKSIYADICISSKTFIRNF